VGVLTTRTPDSWERRTTMKNVYVFDQCLAHGDEEPIWEYEDYGKREQDLTLPMLPPPKRFLMRGSTYWVSDNVKYTFWEESYKVPFASEIRVQKYHNIEDTKLRLLKLNYFFLRDKDCMSEKKSGYRSVVYNVKTKALYVLKASPHYKTTKKGNMAKKHSWKKSVVRVSLNSYMLAMEMEAFDRKHKSKFVADLYRIVSKEVPGVKPECNGDSNNIIALIIQHRIGKAIPGLNDICISNLGYMAAHQFIDRRLTIMKEEERGRIRPNNWEQHEKDIMKLKRKSVYQFIPVLSDTTSLRKALQVLLGECYVSIFPKLIFDIDFQSLSAGQADSLIRYKEGMPKNIQHYVSQSISKMTKNKFQELLREVMDLSRTTVDDHIKDNWIRTVRRMKTTIPWRAWSDTYRMAGQLGLRIRPNAFANVQEIWAMHDRLSGIIQRQNRISWGINISSDAQFIEVEYPEKFKGYTFRQLMSPADLQEETNVMGHCVHSYKNDCVKGHSVIFSATDPDGVRYTIEYETTTFHFAQAEGSTAALGGMRNICSDELKSAIFIPFASVLAQRNKDCNYQALSMLNLTIIESFTDIAAVEDTLDITPGLAASVGTDELEDAICRRNALLEKLIYIQRNLKDYKNYATLIYDIDNLLEAHGFGKKPPQHRRPRAMPAPRQAPAMPVPVEAAEPTANNLILEADATELDDSIPF